MRHGRGLGLVTLAASVSLLAGACAPEGAEPAAGGNGGAGAPQLVTVKGADYSFSGPASVPAGKTELRLENAGAALHQIQRA